MNNKILKLKELGFKLTPQRLAVIDFLEGNKTHPSINNIYESLKLRYPTISLATVYNTIDTLVKNNMLLELPITKDKSNYDPDMSLHDHAYCLKCGKIFDIQSDKESEITNLDHVELKEFKILSVRKIYNIVCNICLLER
jgi:Fur family transcriptional regulator, peroxide stress response regulator